MFIKEIFFPKFCLGCGYLGAYVCPGCVKKLKPIKEQTCLYCGEQSLFGLTHARCQRRGGVDGVLAVFYYNNLFKKIIKNFKYRLVRRSCDDLFKIIDKETWPFTFYSKTIDDCFIQPVPLHPERLRERGFNQAEIVAKFLARKINAPLLNLLERKKPTPPLAQSGSKKERYLKIRGAFQTIKNSLINGKKIVLADDVLTSGLTIREAAKTLKTAGAERVFAFVLAR